MTQDRFGYVISKTLDYLPKYWRVILPAALISELVEIVNIFLPGVFPSVSPWLPLIVAIISGLLTLGASGYVQLILANSVITDRSSIKGPLVEETDLARYFRVFWANIKITILVIALCAPAFLIGMLYGAQALNYSLILTVPLFIWILPRVGLAMILAALGKKECVQESWDITRNNWGLVFGSQLALLITFIVIISALTFLMLFMAFLLSPVIMTLLLTIPKVIAGVMFIALNAYLVEVLVGKANLEAK